jgi:hypothetical protein
LTPLGQAPGCLAALFDRLVDDGSDAQAWLPNPDADVKWMPPSPAPVSAA